jgi:hypothetical protein
MGVTKPRTSSFQNREDSDKEKRQMLPERREMKINRWLIPFALGFGLTMALLLVLNRGTALATYAAPPPTLRYVAPTGADALNLCTVSGSPCRTLQHAVDVAASGDHILVATGVYTDLHTHSVPPGYFAAPASGVVTQVLYVGKTVVIRGGYTTAFTNPPNPEANPTILSVPIGQRGRVIFIAGDIAPTLYGLRIVGGGATGLGGAWGNHDGGGGVFIITATATFETNWVYGNTAYDGGGLYLWKSASVFSQNTIMSNTATFGGGLSLRSSDATLDGNAILSNTAVYGGGGAYLNYSDATLNGNTVVSNSGGIGGGLRLDWQSDATLTGNTIASNIADYEGGGVSLNYSAATLADNTIMANVADDGGGLKLENDSRATLRANTIVSNTAYDGGGMYIRYSAPRLENNIVMSNAARQGSGLYLENSDAVLTNTVIVGNRGRGSYSGNGVYVVASSPRLLHTTIARNGGSGVCVTEDTLLGYSSATLINTILVSHTVGISVTTGNTATLEGTLWYGNSADWSGAGAIFTGAYNTWGDPRFAADGYHLLSGSAALNKGVSAGVTTDIDGDPRPYCVAADLGADEAIGDFACSYIYLPLTLKSY